MNIGQVLLAVALSFISKTATVRIGNYTVSATDEGGAAAHLTASNIVLAYETFTASGSASVKSGTTVISITKNS